MGNSTRKGYDLTIKAFIPFDPQDMFNEAPSPKETVKDVRKLLVERGCLNIEVTPKARARKTIKKKDAPDDDLAGSDMPHAAA